MKSKTPKIFIGFAIMVFVLCIPCLVAYQWIKFQLSPTYFGPVTFTIENQSTLDIISKLIQEKGYVRHARVFSLYLRYKEADRFIKAGDYSIEAYTSLDDLVDILIKGQEKYYTFTIPEGYNLRQIAKKLSQEGLLNESEFLSLAMSPPVEIRQSLLDNFPEEASLEGFLFPETYHITRPDALRIIHMMCQQFKSVFMEEYAQRAYDLSFTPYEVVILASIIEKETQYANEFPLVSSVFHNRLRDGWNLEACSTVEYVIEKEAYVLSLEELKIDSPYNTYLYSGLPAGPIANPGKRSIEAALYPDTSPYYFFVAKGDGTHAFSKTLSEHQRNVRIYLP